MPKLKAYLDRVDRHFRIEHHLTDTSGRDLVTGEDRSAWLTQKQRAAFAVAVRNVQFDLGIAAKQHVMVAPASASSPYRWIVVLQPINYDPWTFLPYYLLVFVAIALLCWLLAVNLATPLRALARTVDRFGRGDLSARVHSRRRDEIGNLARAFDEMAERMETLLTAERRLLQDISHELRTPLARLSFAAELSRTAEDRNAATARLKKEIGRLTDLVGALLQVTRAEGDPVFKKPDRSAAQRFSARSGRRLRRRSGGERVPGFARDAPNRCISAAIASCCEGRLKTSSATRSVTRRKGRRSR